MSIDLSTDQLYKRKEEINEKCSNVHLFMHDATMKLHELAQDLNKISYVSDEYHDLMKSIDKLIEETNVFNTNLSSLVLEHNEIVKELDKRRKLNIDT